MKTVQETEISHTGFVEKQNDDGSLMVRIIAAPTCVSCSANGTCSASDMEEKLIEVANPEGHFAKGDTVKVVLNQSAGLKAVMLGYVYPFLVLFITLIIMINITDSQGIAGLVALAMLVPYYLLLYVTKTRHKKTFEFKIRR